MADVLIPFLETATLWLVDEEIGLAFLVETYS